MLLEELKTDLIKALKKREEVRVSTLRLLLSEITNQEIAKQSKLTEEEITAVIQKEIKKRQEAKDLFLQGQRGDLASKEEAEELILKDYLPAQLLR